MRQRFGEIHAAAASQRNFSLLIDDAFAQRRQCHRELDRRARLRAARQRQLLVDHGQNASAGRFDRHHGAVHVAERINGCLTNHRVFTRSHVAFGNVARKRTGVETLVVMAAARGTHRPRCRGVVRARSAAVRQGPHALPRVLIFRHAMGLLMRSERAGIDAGGNAAGFQHDGDSCEKCETKKTGPELHFTIPGRTRPICCLPLIVGLVTDLRCKSLAKSPLRWLASGNCPIVGDLRVLTQPQTALFPQLEFSR